MTINLCFTRKDYLEWVKQHESWCFDTRQKSGDDSEDDERALALNGNRIAMIVGAFGENKGAVRCAQNI